MKEPRGLISHGIVTGILGATAMALWFLIVDGSQGAPLRTPTFLAGALLNQEGIEFTAGAVFVASMVHYAAFIMVGLMLAWFCMQLTTTPNTLMGLAVGFLLFDIVFYTSVTVTGVDIVGALGWPAVLVGNLLAGIVMTGFLRVTGATKPIPWWERLSEHRILREGIVAGLIGAGAVAAWFLIFDLSRGEPFFTPGALGSALFFGATDISQVDISLSTVFGYTAVHIAAFVATGLVAATVLVEAETKPPMLMAGLLLFAAFEAFSMGLMALIAEFLLGSMTWWTILVGNLIATGCMGFYLWRQHPGLVATLGNGAVEVVG